MLLEGAAFESAQVHPEAVRVDISSQDASLSGSLAAGAGGAGARLETSFAQSSHSKVRRPPEQHARCQLRVAERALPASLSLCLRASDGPERSVSWKRASRARACGCRWRWPAACWWMRWAASAPLQRRRAAAGSRTAWCSWWAAARTACPAGQGRTCCTPSRPSTGLPASSHSSIWLKDSISIQPTLQH